MFVLTRVNCFSSGYPIILFHYAFFLFLIRPLIPVSTFQLKFSSSTRPVCSKDRFLRPSRKGNHFFKLDLLCDEMEQSDTSDLNSLMCQLHHYVKEKSELPVRQASYKYYIYVFSKQSVNDTGIIWACRSFETFGTKSTF